MDTIDIINAIDDLIKLRIEQARVERGETSQYSESLLHNDTELARRVITDGLRESRSEILVDKAPLKILYPHEGG